MKLLSILLVMGLVWCVAGAAVLGPGLLVYPAAWGVIVLAIFGLHKLVQGTVTRQSSPKTEAENIPLPEDSRMVSS